jgi:hypothetical protein
VQIRVFTEAGLEPTITTVPIPHASLTPKPVSETGPLPVDEGILTHDAARTAFA